MRKISIKYLILSIKYGLARRRREGGNPLPHSSQLRQGSDGQAFSILHSPSRRILSPTPYTLNPNVNPRSGFTLLELIVVLAILTVLIGAVVFVLDPLQMTARARDTARMSDLDAISEAIGFADAEGPSVESGGFDPDGSNTGTCANESTPTVYVSVPSSETETPPNDLPSGWTYSQVLAVNLQNIDGSGWLPVNFTAGGATSPISSLPLDASNKFSSGFYYSYVCHSNGSFELNTRMVSDDRRTAGPNDVQSDDGGDDRYIYEVGSDLTLDPKPPIGYWPFGVETSGSIANNTKIGLEDIANNGHDGTAKNADGTGMQFAQGVNGGTIDFDGVDDYASIGIGNDYFPLPRFSICAWEKTPGLGAGMSGSGIFSLTYGLTFTIDSSGRFYTAIDNGVSAPAVTATGNLYDDSWHYLCLTFDGTNRYMYIDGVENISAPTTWLGTTRWPTNGVRIGTNINNGPLFIFNGEIDETLIYSRALAAAEVRYQYDSLKP